MYEYIATTRGLIIVSHWELDCRRRYYNAALTSVRLTSTGDSRVYGVPRRTITSRPETCVYMAFYSQYLHTLYNHVCVCVYKEQPTTIIL